jgi:hypothetical protein
MNITTDLYRGYWTICHSMYNMDNSSAFLRINGSKFPTPKGIKERNQNKHPFYSSAPLDRDHRLPFQIKNLGAIWCNIR